jgi:DNA-binding NarL/FixJ family response regulator
MTRVRILIADDHEILRNGMRVLLEREPGWVVCGQATTGNDVVAMAIELKPDVILLDISMPGTNGLQAARQIRRSVPSPIVFMSMYDAPDFEREAINAGASGFVSKADSANKLIEAVRTVLARKTFFSSQATAAQQAGKARGKKRAAGTLTAREREVLHLLAEGHTNKQVAARLGITTKTAETHRARIISKLELHSVSGLVRYAIRHKIIEA